VFTSAYSSAPRETARCILLVWRDHKWAYMRGAVRLKRTETRNKAVHNRHTVARRSRQPPRPPAPAAAPNTTAGTPHDRSRSRSRARAPAPRGARV